MSAKGDREGEIGMTPDWDDEDWYCDDHNTGYRESLDCDHSEADVDLITGEMTCGCGFHKYLTDDEMRREAEIQTEMMEAYHQQMLDEDAAIEKARADG
jgi:hypothetical protein